MSKNESNGIPNMPVAMDERLEYNTSISFNGNVSFELNQGTYSDETEIISPYIANIFTSIKSALEGFNSLVQSATSYFEENKEIENMPLPDLQEINFSVDLLPNNGRKTKNATVTLDGYNTLNIRPEIGTKKDPIGSVPNNATVEVLDEKGTDEQGNEWIKISYSGEKGFVKTENLKYN
ncbi:MAG: SH3 domain-containing protein [Bacilli bacterium]|nr:SH3 domain-containing protein [Bacilli bacterium]